MWMFSTLSGVTTGHFETNMPITDALRNKTALPDARPGALRDFTLKLVRERGNLDDETVQAFLDAGFARRYVLEVILGYSQKTMWHYTNYIAKTPIDKAFHKFEWHATA